VDGHGDLGRPSPVTWESAWRRALYGPGGLYRGGAGPAAHFRTAVHAAPHLLAAALLRLARRHRCRTVLDIGAGRGELLTAMSALPQAAGLRLHGVDVVGRPDMLPAAVGWCTGIDALPAAALGGALVLAWELLDDLPCPVLEVDEDGIPRTVLVDAAGRELLGERAVAPELDWCARWWPLDGAEPGTRAEVGLPRDQWWARLVHRAHADRERAGDPVDHPTVLLAVDYAHRLGNRPPDGSLSAFRAGRAVPAAPDGSCDVTAHVALDAVAAAGERAGAVGTRLTDQRTALRELGVGAVGRPDAAALPAGPAALPAGPAALPAGPALLRQMVDRSLAAELLDPGSLGGFGWLLQRVES
jgi:SAM-dependent MidA family methyltransferase